MLVILTAPIVGAICALAYVWGASLPVQQTLWIISAVVCIFSIAVSDT